jgi:hypothetical protein
VISNECLEILEQKDLDGDVIEYIKQQRKKEREERKKGK